MGVYDIPACLDYILSVNTKCEKILYLSHSQGGTALLSGLSTCEEKYKDKISCIVLLSPIVKVDKIYNNLLKFFNKLGLDMETPINETLYKEVLPYDPDFLDINIKLYKLISTMSFPMLELTTHESSWVNCPERVQVYFSHFPCGTSLKNILHYKQIMSSGKFQYFDYGPEGNLRHYSSEFVSEYPLRKKLNSKIIKNIPPIILACGSEDKISTPLNNMKLKEEIKPFSFYEFQFLSHASFFVGADSTWFNFILRDIYKILDKLDEKSYEGGNLLITESRIFEELNTSENKIEKDNFLVIPPVRKNFDLISKNAHTDNIVSTNFSSSNNEIFNAFSSTNNLISRDVKLAQKSRFINGSFEGEIKLISKIRKSSNILPTPF
jgi:hypothetical protein